MPAIDSYEVCLQKVAVFWSGEVDKIYVYTLYVYIYVYTCNEFCDISYIILD